MCPLYDFRNTDTGDEFEEFMSMSEKETYLKKNKNIEAIFKGGGQRAIIDSVRLKVTKTDNGFKDVLRKIKAAHPRGTIDV